MEFIHIIMPLGDGVSIEDIPQDVKEAAKRSVKMWEEYLENETRHKIEECEREIAKLTIENESIHLPQIGGGFNGRYTT